MSDTEFRDVGVRNITSTGYIDIGEIATPGDPDANTSRIYAADEGGFTVLHYDDPSGVDFEVSRDSVHVVRNTTGATITKGQLVYVNGSNGTFPTVALADASSKATASVFGLVVADISNNSFGQVLQQGDQTGLDTSAFTDGDTLYLSTTAGGLTATAPSGTDLTVEVGTVVKGGTVGGGIVNIDIRGAQENTPQFSAIELGHASDTTLARSSAGNMTIEGNLAYRAGGTDVPVTDGGTGSSTAAGARGNLGVAIGSDVQAWSAVLDATTASYTMADKTKVDYLTVGQNTNLDALEIVDTAGTGLAYTATPTVAWTSYTDKASIYVRLHTDNLAYATLNVSGLGSKPIFIPQFSGFLRYLTDGEIIQDVVYFLAYDSSNDGFSVANGSGTILTAPEWAQLQKINSVTISNTQWGYLGGLNQAVNTAASPEFAGGTYTGNLTFNDNAKALFGTGSDASIYYDGTDFQFDSQEVGSGDFIFNNGNVGIGTTPGPTANLQIGDGSSTQSLVLLGPNSNTDSSTIYFGDNFNSAAPGYSGLSLGYDSSGNYLKVTDELNDSIRVIIERSGNVGIGTIPPSCRLHVEDSVSDIISYVNATNATYASDVFRVRATRAATSAYDLAAFQSNNGGDNEFRLRGDGNGYCDGSWSGGGADYAEYFEWADGNPDNEDRRGISVVLERDKIRPAKDGEAPIGVISGNPSVIGDGDMDRWKGKYLRDDFGSYVWEDYEVVEWEAEEAVEVGEDEEPKTKTVSHSYALDNVPDDLTVPDDAKRTTQQRRKLNPKWKPDQEYIPREDRPEWATVGLMGKLRVRKGQPVADSWIKMRRVSKSVDEWLVK